MNLIEQSRSLNRCGTLTTDRMLELLHNDRIDGLTTEFFHRDGKDKNRQLMIRLFYKNLHRWSTMEKYHDPEFRYPHRTRSGRVIRYRLRRTFLQNKATVSPAIERLEFTLFTPFKES